MRPRTALEPLTRRGQSTAGPPAERLTGKTQAAQAKTTPAARAPPMAGPVWAPKKQMPAPMQATAVRAVPEKQIPAPAAQVQSAAVAAQAVQMQSAAVEAPAAQMRAAEVAARSSPTVCARTILIAHCRARRATPGACPSARTPRDRGTNVPNHSPATRTRPVTSMGVCCSAATPCSARTSCAARAERAGGSAQSTVQVTWGASELADDASVRLNSLATSSRQAFPSASLTRVSAWCLGRPRACHRRHRR